MDDALCGPSNPLQSFKTHSQVDRTVQQDRLTGTRHSPAQGFRTPDPRTGSLDAEFAAFEAGPQQLFHLQQQPFHNFGPAPSLPQSGQQYVHSAPGWAADFQKLHLGPAQSQPIPQNQSRSQVPMARSSIGRGAGRWHDEFMRQEQQYSGSNVSGKQPVRSQMAGLGYLQNQPFSQYQFAHQQPGAYQGPHDLSQADAYQAGHMDVAHNAAFEEAFVQAEDAHAPTQKEPLADLSSARELAGVRLDPIFNNRTSDLNTSQFGALQPHQDNLFQTPPEQKTALRIGSDAIPASETKTAKIAEQNSRDADELARTAGQLLNSVEDETSLKFQQSQFLTLMRHIRDHEVEVRGDEFRETTKTPNTQALAGGRDAETEAAQQDPVIPTGNALDDYHASMELLAAQNRKRSSMAWGSDIPVEAAQQNPVIPTGNALDDYYASMEVLETQNRKRSSMAWGPDMESQQTGEENQRIYTGTMDERQLDEEMQRRGDVQALHPGGRMYPIRPRPLSDAGDSDAGHDEDDRHKYDHWASGGIVVEDERIEESPGLAGRFSRASVKD